VDVIVENGVIRAIGRGLSREGATLIIDAEGRHVTPGIVDMHSHLGTHVLPVCRARARVQSYDLRVSCGDSSQACIRSPRTPTPRRTVTR
jgi:imidazolonepropionase-like amidohydrolase